MCIFVTYHLEMGLKQNEGKSNSVATDWKYYDCSEAHTKVCLAK